MIINYYTRCTKNCRLLTFLTAAGSNLQSNKRPTKDYILLYTKPSSPSLIVKPDKAGKGASVTLRANSLNEKVLEWPFVFAELTCL